MDHRATKPCLAGLAREQVWDLPSSCVLHESAVLGAYHLTALCMDPSSGKLAVGDAAGVVRIFDASNLQLCRPTQVRLTERFELTGLKMTDSLKWQGKCL